MLFAYVFKDSGITYFEVTAQNISELIIPAILRQSKVDRWHIFAVARVVVSGSACAA